MENIRILMGNICTMMEWEERIINELNEEKTIKKFAKRKNVTIRNIKNLLKQFGWNLTEEALPEEAEVIVT